MSIFGNSKVFIKDMLYVNRIESRLGRKLTEHELEDSRFEVKFPSGRWESIVIPKLEFPYDLISIPDRNPDKPDEETDDI